MEEPPRIKEGAFRFADSFPHSKRREFFEQLERETYGLKLTSDQVFFEDFAWGAVPGPQLDCLSYRALRHPDDLQELHDVCEECNRDKERSEPE